MKYIACYKLFFMKNFLHFLSIILFSTSLFAQAPPTMSIHQEELEYYNGLGLTTDAQFDALNGTTKMPAMLSKAGCSLEKIVFGYHPYWVGSTYLNYRWDLLSDLCYFSYEVDTLTGNAYSTHSWSTAAVVDTALAHGTRVHLCVTLFDGHTYFLTHASAKQTLITNLINLVTARGAHGVNIDFEGVPSSQKANLTAFLIDLCNQMHLANPAYKVSIAAPAVNWSGTYDVAALSGYLDWFVIMGYDYYWSGSSTAGPGSGLYSMTCSTNDNLSRSLSYYLDAGAANTQIVLALPYYGREWHTTSSSVPSSTIPSTSSSRTYKYVQDNASGYYSNANMHWEPNSFSPYHVFNDGVAWHQCFADNEKSLEYRYDMIYLRNIAGIGIWALGYDDTYTALWDLIENKLTDCRTVPCSDTLYDLGGPGCNYFNDEDFTWTLSPTNATGVSLTFSSFDLESGWDSLWIYNGPTTASPLLGRYSGTTNPGTITATGGDMTLRYHSDNATTRTGWQAIWNCAIDNIPPVTSVSAANWETQDFSATFTDTDNVGTQELLYQVLDYDNTEWRANGAYGFFNDNFTSALHPDWVADSGTWSINAGRLNQTIEANGNSNIYATVTQLNTGQWLYHWQMNIGGALTNRRAGLHFFCDSAAGVNRGNSYFVYYRADDDKVQIYETTDDVFSMKTNDACAIDPSTWYDCKILYNAVTGSIKAYLNDVLVSQWIDTTPLPGGNTISLRSGSCNVLFDDVKVYRSRATTAAITVGPGMEVRYQNPNPATPACRIKSIITDINGLWSMPVGTDVNIDWTAPDTATWLYDGAGADIDTSSDLANAWANWNAATDPNSGIQTYLLALGFAPGDSSVANWTDVGNVLNASHGALPLLTDTLYYFSLKAVNAAGLFSEYSHSDGFIVYLFTAIDDLAGISGLSVFPNPFDKELSVRFQLSAATDLNISLEGMKGELLSRQSQHYEAGSHLVTLLIPESFAAQSCILRIQLNNKEVRKTLIHIKN